MLQLLRRIHRWIGLVLVIPVGLVALSGTLLVFRDSYHRMRWPIVDRPQSASEVEAQPLLLRMIEERYAGGRVRIIKFPRAGVNAFHVYLADDGEVLVDPRSGREIVRWHWTSDPAAFLFELHANLLMGARGELANGYAALLLVFLTFSGVLLWLPRRRTAFRLRDAVPRTLSAASLLKSHAASGVILAGGVLIFAVTGAGLVFYTEAGRLASVWFDAAAPEAPSAVIPPESRQRASWPEVLAAANRAWPESGPAMYYPGTPGNAVLTFRKRLPGEWHPNGRSYVLVDPYTAGVVQTIDARRQGAGTRGMHALYPVHAAKVGGLPLILVALVSGVGLAWLAAGGAWSYGVRAARSRRSPRVIGSEESNESTWSVGYGRQEERPHPHNAARTSRQQQPVAANRRRPRSGDAGELPLPREDQPLRS